MLSSLASYANASSSDTSSSICFTPMAAMSPRPREQRRRPAPIDTSDLQATVPAGFGFSAITDADADASPVESSERVPLLLQPSGTNYETVTRISSNGTRRIALLRGNVELQEDENNVPTYIEDAAQDGQAPPLYEVVVAPSPVVEAPPTFQPTSVQISAPNRLATLVLGTTRARKAAIARAQRQARRIDDAHAGWAAIGIDTRSLMAQGQPLPPHFFSPPRCNPAQIELAIKHEFGL